MILECPICTAPIHLDAEVFTDPAGYPDVRVTEHDQTVIDAHIATHLTPKDPPCTN